MFDYVNLHVDTRGKLPTARVLSKPSIVTQDLLVFFPVLKSSKYGDDWW